MDSAINYLMKNDTQNVGMISAILRNSADIVRATESGVLLIEKESRVPMISADDLEAVELLTEDFHCYVIIIHQMFMRDYLQKKYNLKHSNECTQAVYTKKTPLPLSGALTIRPLTSEHLDYVCKNYHMSSPKHIEEAINKGYVFGGFNQRGTLVGFIGLHTDGSMGMLFINSRYRGKGYANELESFLINYLVERNRIPYSHILLNNEKSLNLQKSLGHYLCEEHISWLF